MLKRILTPSSQPLLYSNCNHLTSHKELADWRIFWICLSRAINRPFCWWSPRANGVKSLRARFISWTPRFKRNKAWGPGLPNMCNVEKNGEKKRGAEPFESIYLQSKIYDLISCYINIIGGWAGVIDTCRDWILLILRQRLLTGKAGYERIVLCFSDSW